MLSQYPDLKQVGRQIANWDRTEDHDKMQSMLPANPNVMRVIAGNDEMALGAIAALKEGGKLASVNVDGFDGPPDFGGRDQGGRVAIHRVAARRRVLGQSGR